MAPVHMVVDLRRAIVADEKELTDLDKIAREIDPKAKIEFRTAEGMVHKASKLSEVFEFPNSKQERITTLEWDHEYGSSIIRITSETFITNVTLSIDAPDAEKARSIVRALKTWFQENRAPYWLLAELQSFWVVAVGFASALLLVFSSKTLPSRVAWALAWIEIVAFASWGLFVLLRTRLFPMLALKTGHGKKRYKLAGTWRLSILGALVLGTLTSIFANFITR